MANPIIIDISHWQPAPNWEKVKAGGTVGVILKATEGESYTDPTYAGREIGAKETGLFVATYHFLRPGDMEAQMARYVSVVAPEPGDRLCIDYEDENVSFSDLEKAALWLMQNTACEVAIYGSNILVDACKGKKSEVLSLTSLWQARYSSNPPAVPTNIWKTWSVWQFTDAATCDGINAKVDGNKWNGDPDNIESWFYAPQNVPKPEPETDWLEVPIDLTIGPVPAGVKVVVSINGRRVE